MKLTTECVKLILKHPFQTAHGGRSYSANVVMVFLEAEGLTGVGEAASCGYLEQNADRSLQALRKMADYLPSDPFEIEDTMHLLEDRFPENQAARCAIDIALHDLVGKVTGLPLYRYFGLSAGEAKKTSFTIGIDTVEKVAEKVEEARDYSILKVKLGSPQDLEIIRKVRELTDATIRVDANAGWKYDEAVKMMRTLADLGVEFVEQPLAREDLNGHAKLKKLAILPIYLDESVQTSRDIPAAACACDGVNVKLTKSGGLREAYRMIATARACGLKVMLGCMVASSVKITASAHLSPLADCLDLDGNLLISNDPYRGVITAFGEMLLPDRPGLGLVDAFDTGDWHD
jgi:L-Ala-D/L-Glu epimerase